MVRAVSVVVVVALVSGCGAGKGSSLADSVASETFVTNQFPTSIPPSVAKANTDALAAVSSTVAPVVSTPTVDPLEADRVAIKALIAEVDEELIVLMASDSPDFTKLRSLGVPNSLTVASIVAFVRKFKLDGKQAQRRDIFERLFYEITFENDDTAKIKSCFRNNTVVFRRNDTPTNDDDEVIGDKIGIAYETETLERWQGQWRLSTSGGQDGVGESCASSWPF